MAGGSPRWFAPPKPGDLVWCRFPEGRLPGPGPKPRPALVLQVGEAGGRPVVALAYGTSRKLERLYPGEFAIAPSDGDAFDAAGLSYATKFNLARTFELDYNDTWFDVAPGAPHGQTPKLGLLHPSLVKRARAAFNAARTVLSSSEIAFLRQDKRTTIEKARASKR